MKRIVIISRETGDARVLEDLLRAHFPGAKIESAFGSGDDAAAPGVRPDCKVPDKGIYGKQQPDGIRPDGLSTGDDILLNIARTSPGPGFTVTLNSGGKSYTRTEVLAPERFPEEEINRRRRLLRLAVYQVIARYLNDRAMGSDTAASPGAASPWGILTGVRPTKIVHRLRLQGFGEERIRRHLERDYGISREKARLLMKVARAQLPFLLEKEESRRLVSLYVGIPFCPTRCHYCSFPSFSLQRWGYLLEDYLAGLAREIKAVGQLLNEAGTAVRTVYLGGGTPTLLPVDRLDELLGVIAGYFRLEKTREITVEGGRPETLDYEKLAVMKKRGVSRLSINPQTMHQPTLEVIGRKHTVGEIIEAYRLAREVGFPVLNMDLIIGLPGENTSILRDTLECILGLRPENITLHALAIKRASLYKSTLAQVGTADPAKTVLAEGKALPKGTAPGKKVAPERPGGQPMMDLAQNMLEQAGYVPYYLYRQKEILDHGENVGYALEGAACIYNIQMIEERQTIIGFGVGASSKLVRVEDWSVDNLFNPRDLEVYLTRLDEIITRKVDKLRAFIYNNS